MTNIEQTCPAANSLQTLLTLVTTIINTKVPVDVAQIQRNINKKHFDFIVVGAGAAGCVVANRLSEIPEWSVLLLEAGGEEPELASIPALYGFPIGTDIDWSFKSAGQNDCGDRPCITPRGKVLGGTTVINGMIYNRGNRRDYDHWAELGNHGWGYKDVLPYFKKSENNLDPDIKKDTIHHGTGGYLNVGRYPIQDKSTHVILDAFQEIGYPIVNINSENVTGVMHVQSMQSNGKRQSTNTAFIHPVRNRNNLKVVTNVRVTKVLIHPDTKTAYGVEYAIETNKSFRGEVYTKKEVILSAGVFNSAQLLLLSGVGPRLTLETLNIDVIQDLKVGHNLQDHTIIIPVIFILKKEYQILPDNQKLLEDAFTYYHDRGKSNWSNGLRTIANVNSRYASKNGDYPDLNIFLLPHLNCTHQTNPICYYDSLIGAMSLLRPKNIHYLTINNTDPFVQPLIYTNYLRNKEDLGILLDGYNILKAIGDTKAFRNAGFVINFSNLITKDDLVSGRDISMKSSGGFPQLNSYHQVGTNKMGPKTDSSAVVNPELKVHGVNGLRVADASIMPQITSGNPTAPIIMIGEKAADMIKESYQTNEI